MNDGQRGIAVSPPERHRRNAVELDGVKAVEEGGGLQGDVDRCAIPTPAHGFQRDAQLT
jgi:hypothetical protein